MVHTRSGSNVAILEDFLSKYDVHILKRQLVLQMIGLLVSQNSCKVILYEILAV